MKRIYNVNDAFFSSIDTHAKAYILGFLFADGCITDPKEFPSVAGYNSSLRVSAFLNARDLCVLEFIKSSLDYTGPIRTNKRAQVGLCIVSNSLCGDLIKAGCTQRKSKTAAFPGSDILPDHLVPSFLCGVLDGDGCVYQSHRGRAGLAPNLSVNIVVSYAFGVAAQSVIERATGLRFVLKPAKTVYKGSPDPHSHVWRMIITGTPQTMRFLDWVYRSVPFCLERKRIKFTSIRGMYDEQFRFIETDEWKAAKSARVIKGLMGRPCTEQARLKISLKARERQARKVQKESHAVATNPVLPTP